MAENVADASFVVLLASIFLLLMVRVSKVIDLQQQPSEYQRNILQEEYEERL